MKRKSKVSSIVRIPAKSGSPNPAIGLLLDEESCPLGCERRMCIHGLLTLRVPRPEAHGLCGAERGFRLLCLASHWVQEPYAVLAEARSRGKGTTSTRANLSLNIDRGFSPLRCPYAESSHRPMLIEALSSRRADITVEYMTKHSSAKGRKPRYPTNGISKILWRCRIGKM